MANNPPRKVDIKGQPHMLAYITPEEGGILQLLGGSGKPGPMGIPSFELGDSFSGPGADSAGADAPSVDDSGNEAQDSFDDGGGSPEDYGMTQADFDFATNIGQQTGGFGDDNTAQEIANYLAQPQVGQNRSNITNLVDATTGRSLYDPTFAAAFDISRGLDPTNNMGGAAGLAVPSYLRPQIESGRVDARGEPIRYYSGVERFLQEDLPDFMRDIPTPMNLLGKALDSITGAVDKGKSFFADATGGYKSTSDFFSGIFDSTPGRDFMQNDDSGDNVGFDSRGQNVFKDKTRPHGDPGPEISEEERLRLEEEKRRQEELERQRRLNQLYDMSRDATMFQVASDAPRLPVGPFSTNLAPSGGILDNFGVNLANVEENIRNINRLNI